MSERIDFTRNYNDLSTDSGFQFEFLCDRCGSGTRSRFQASTLGQISGALGTASSLFGGIFGRVSEVGEQIRSANWQKARDEAFINAARELHPDFIQCPRCQSWVCRAKCWNTKRGLCKECAPDLGVEMSAAQSSRSVEEIWSHAAMSAEDKQLSEDNWRETIMGSCPECEQPLASNAKFCPNCGAQLKKKTECSACGATQQPGAKFCTECGHKAG